MRPLVALLIVKSQNARCSSLLHMWSRKVRDSLWERWSHEAIVESRNAGISSVLELVESQNAKLSSLLDR